MRKNLGPISLIISVSILFQCCQIYHKQTVTINQAIESKSKVKIITVDDREMHFEKIKIEDDILYGVQRIKGQSINIIIPQSDIKEIFLKNQPASDVVTIAVILGSVGLVLFLLVAYELSNGPF